MANFALPSWFKPSSFSLRMSTNQRVFSSPFGGSEQAVDMLNDRWLATLALPARINTEGGALEALLGSFRGQVNTCNLWHMQRPVLRGTMRGSPTCGAASMGAASVTLSSAGVGATLLAGDMIGISGLLLQVAADATANGSGVMTVTLVNRLRTAISGGAAVTWDKPTAPFRMMTGASVLYQPGYADGVSLDFAEVIA